MNRYFIRGFVATMAMGIATLAGQTQGPAQQVYATLQKPGASAGYVNSSLKLGFESTAGFFAVTGETLRVGGADYKIIENAQASKDGSRTYSLQDAKGRFLIFTNNAVRVSATPAGDAQWFQILKWTAAQKTQYENRMKANKNRGSQPGFEVHTD